MSTSITAPTALSATPFLNGTNTTTGANATANLTVLILPQLTTQFVPPSQCTPVQNWTAATVSYTLGDSEGNFTYPQILVPVTDAQYSACQPSGWNNINSSYLFSYSKAVCPSGYNYNQLSDLFNDQPNTETIRTTAYCCPSGFTYSMFYNRDIIGISGGNCMKTVTLTPTTAQTTPSATTTGSSTTPSASASETAKSASLAARNATGSAPLTPGPSVVTMFYQPWFIEWEKKDASELSPSPPVVSVQFPVKTWEPGTEIDPSLTRKQTNPDALNKGLGQIIGIVVGCIAAAFAGISAVALWLCVRSRRKEREAFQREEHQLQEQRLRYIGEYQRSRSPTDDEPLPVYVKACEQDKATVAGIAVPRYKERPSSESSRHSHQQDYRNTSEGGNNIHQDTDGLTLHDQHTLENSAPIISTEAHSSGRRH